MSEKRMFKVGYVEYPQTTLYYDALDVDVSKYPELEGKSDQEVIDYIKEHAWEMESTDPNIYDSLAEELQDMEIVREKIPHVESDYWAEPSKDDSTDDEDDSEEDD